ncbi:MAG: Cdc6/Cdc18 family protein [Nitrososphaeria archaeon]|nr:AAA family ATPase [Conexivisphaerales archaeon]
MTNVFKDRSKLLPTYVPNILPHREKEFESIKKALLESEHSSVSTAVQIVGDVGTGKTVTLLKLARDLKKDDLRFAYVNPRQHGATRVLVFRHICRSLTPEVYSASYSPEELLLATLTKLKEDKAKAVIMIDDVDYLLFKTKEPIIYNLTRLNELLPFEDIPVAGVILTAKNIKFRESLDRSEASSLGNRIIVFERYTKRQIFDIIQRRVEEAIKPGVIDEKVVEYLSEVTSSPPVNGDIRYAIDVLLNAGSICDAQNCQKITIEHIRKAISYTSLSVTQEEISNMDQDLRKVLLAVALALKESDEAYVSLDNIYSVYKELNKKRDVDMSKFLEMLQDLGDRGVVDIKGLTKIGISGVPVENLTNFLEGLLDKL